MRLASSLALPTEVERARTAGELVIFAGAGVSMGPPASLPGFKDLARQIAEPKVRWDGRKYRSAFDRYLGDAERAGVQVQERAREILSTDSEHNPLHEYLVGVFGDPTRIRLITTNFDSHFSSAAARVFAEADIPHYFGPALPPGNDFRGLAHLHGALVQAHNRLVLTDRDFGEAYMADGWAARFLVRAFSDRTVLFVGYSLGDPVLRYLLHALPPSGRWYGMWHESEIDRGKDHAIAPVTFATIPGRRRFAELVSGMKRWYWYATAKPSDHQRELDRLVTSGPSASPIETDYVRERLRTDTGRRRFWQTATDEAWFEWAAAEGLLDCLTEPYVDDEATRGWAAWAVEHFLNGSDPPLLHFLRGRPVTHAPAFRTQIAMHLCRVDRLPPLAVLRQTIALLVGGSGAEGPPVHLDWLLQRLVDEGAHTEALALLKYATRLHLQPVEKFWTALEQDDIDEPVGLRPLATRVRTLVAPSELDPFLQKNGTELAAVASNTMLSIGLNRLEEAYVLLGLARGVQDDVDWLSFGRTAIARSGQDRFAHAEDVLIVIVRSVLDHWAEVRDETLQAFGEQQSNSDRTLIRRLALYAIARCQTCEPDQVLEHARLAGWARDPWVRPELYLLLSSHYGAASEKARADFVATLRDDDWWGEDTDDHAAHARFSLAQKLLRDAPESAVTEDFAATERFAHPGWAEGDEDGFLSRVEVGWGREEPSPIESASILEWTPTEVVDRVEEALAGDDVQRSGEPVLGSVQQAARMDPRHGIDLFAYAQRTDKPVGSAISEAVLLGLADGDVQETEQCRFLEMSLTDGAAARLVSAYGRLLKKWSEGLDESSAEALLNGLDLAAEVLFDRARAVPPTVSGEGIGWTDRALNHAGGAAAHVWWRVADTRDHIDGQFVLSIDDKEKDRWSAVLEDESHAGDHGRPILGMALDRLSHGDTPWSEAHVFPCFDPQAGWERAAQLWDGRLLQSRWSWTTVELLRPYFDPLFSVSSELVPSRGHQLGDWVAFLVANVPQSGITLQQVHHFIEGASQEARREFARSLPRQIQQLEPAERRELWRRVLRRYWRDRVTNMPLPLAADEVSAMISWVPAFPDVAAEVLSELTRSPGEGMEHADQVLFEWSRADESFATEHPTEAVGVVEYLVSVKALNSWMASDAVSVLERAWEAGADKTSIRRAAEALAELTPTVQPLLDRLDGKA